MIAMPPYKKPVTVTMDPDDWRTFQDLVSGKMPDGDKSASAHLGTLVKRENARLLGEDIPEVLDVIALRKRLECIRKRLSDLQKNVTKRKADMRFEELGVAYGLDHVNWKNVPEVVGKVLADRKNGDDTPLH